MNKRGKQILLLSSVGILAAAVFSVLIAYLAFAGQAPAAAVTTTATLYSANSTSPHQLLNFTIFNANASTNITSINITLPANFTISPNFNGSSAATPTYTGMANFLYEGQVLNWSNSTDSLVASGAGPRYFWIYVNVTTPGTYEINVSISDNSSNMNSTIVNVTVSDITLPTTNLLGPSSGVSTDADNITFRCNATDNVGLANITLFVQDADGNSFTNISIVSGTYAQSNFSHTLGGSTYIWSCYANDTSNNIDSNWINSNNNTLTVSTFSFTGNVKNTTGNVQGVNVTIYAKAFGGQGPPATVNQYSATTDSNGNYTLTGINDSNQMFYQVTFIKNESDGNASWIGPSLPLFPPQPFFKAMSVGFGQTIGPFFNATTVYLQAAGNIRLFAINMTGTPVANGGAINFSYMVSDQALGFPIIEPNFNSLIYNTTIVVPLNRSYSVMFMPQMSPPITINIAPSNYVYNSDSGTYFTNITANTSITLVRVYGWLNTTFSSKNGSEMISIANFTNLTTLNYMVMPGNMTPTSATMPNNIGSFFGEASDEFNGTNGFFNITLPGTTTGMSVLLALYAANDTASTPSTAEYFAGFYSLTTTYGDNDTNVNITLQPLAGTLSSASFGFDSNLSTRYTTINITDPAKNKSAGEALTEIETTYGGITIKWLVESSSNTGTLKMPLLNNTPIVVKIFSQNFAPLRKTIKAADINSSVGMIEIPLYASKAETPDGFDMKDFVVPDFLNSNSSCDVANPSDSCSIMNFSDMSGFNPLKLMLGGSVSVRLKDKVTNIVVHYVNVDLIASGPPVEASFDRNASSSSASSSALSQAWRFGAMGPDIYDRVIIGIPYNATVNEAWSYNISIDYLYGEGWNDILWNISENESDPVPSYYSDFDSTWFTTQGMPCSKTNTTADCYMDTTNNYFWLRIPHFSGNNAGITGAAAASSAASTGGGGGGGGSAVHVKKHSWSRIAANTEATVKVNDYIIGVKQVSFALKAEATDAKMTVSALVSRPGTTAQNKSRVYKYISIDTTNLDNLYNGTIQSMVQKSWIVNNGISYDNLALYRWNTTAGEWQELPTEKASEDLVYAYFTSSVSKFSYFKIAEKEKPVEEEAGEVSGEVTEGEPEGEAAEETVEAEKEKPSRIWLWLGILAIIAIIAAMIVLLKPKKEKK